VTGLVVSAPASAADRSPRIVPRGPGDVVVGPAAGAAGAKVGAAAATAVRAAVSAVTTPPGGAGSAPASSTNGTGGGAATAGGGDPATLAPLRSSRDLAAAATGTSVRVSGVVRGAASGALLLEDAGGVVRLRLAEAAAPLAATARAGDAVAASGTTDHAPDGTVEVRVTDPAAVALLAGPSSGGVATTDAARGTAAADGTGDADGSAAAGSAAAGPPDAPTSADRAVEDAAGPAALDAVGPGVDDPSSRSGDGGPVPLVALVALVVTALAGCAVVLRRRFRGGRLEPAVARLVAALGAAPPSGQRHTAGPSGSTLGLRSAARLDAPLVAGLSSPPTRAEQARPR
jgi:non-specific serine/threonine protein kinase